MTASQANAVFRTVAVEDRNQQGPGGKFYRNFRDNFAFECAAYELAQALGIKRVPPAVPRVLDGKEGSLQAWVENAMTEAKRQEKGEDPPDVLRWAHVQAEKMVFDALINNTDRNTGNELIDRDWNVWWIDHTRAFQTEHGDQRIEGCAGSRPSCGRRCARSSARGFEPCCSRSCARPSSTRCSSAGTRSCCASAP